MPNQSASRTEGFGRTQTCDECCVLSEHAGHRETCCHQAQRHGQSVERDIQLQVHIKENIHKDGVKDGAHGAHVAADRVVDGAVGPHERTAEANL